MGAIRANPLTLVLRGDQERVDIQLVDSAGEPVDATALHLRLLDAAGDVKVEDDFFAPATPPGVTYIVRTGVGAYYWPFGDITVDADNTAANVADFFVHWRATGPTGSAPVSVVQTIKVRSVQSFDLVRALRSQIDKAGMLVEQDPENPVNVGYTDGLLFECLEGGLAYWNMAEPYPTFNSLDDFPRHYQQGLIDAGLLVGIQAQELFAITTDLPNWSDQGNSMVLQHQPQLAAFCTRLATRLDVLIPKAKFKLVRSGSIHVQAGPGGRLAMLVQTAPQGSLFRSFIMAGSF